MRSRTSLGGGGKHHHHHGGNYPGRGFYPMPYYPPYPYPTTSEVFVVSDPCTTLDKVVATDGKIYDNPCLARRAGQSVVRRVNGLGAMDGVMDMLPKSPLGLAALVIGGVVAYRYLKKR